MAAEGQLHRSGDKALQAATAMPSSVHSLPGWQVPHCCQPSVGNPHGNAENVYCGGRTFALWSHLLAVTSRLLIFYHRKFLVGHKSGPLSAAAGGAAVRRAAGLSPGPVCTRAPVPCETQTVCSQTMSQWTVWGAEVTRTIIVLHFMQTKKKCIRGCALYCNKVL